MESLRTLIAQHKEAVKNEQVTDAETLEAFRIKYLGTKGLVKTIMGEMKNVAPADKREAGQLLNEFKTFTENIYEELKAVACLLYTSPSPRD